MRISDWSSDVCSSDLMPYHFPMRVMKQLWMTGGWMDAETALRLSYVNRVVPLGEEEDMAMRFAGQIARMEISDFSANKLGTHGLYESAGLSKMVNVGREPYVPAEEAAMAKETHMRLIHEKGVKRKRRSQ